MNKKSSTKRTLITSALSLVLCMAMLIGTTFAWFTDTVTSNGNIIQAGKLDAELNYKSKLADEWADASEGAIFNYDKWEPGYVDVKYVQVANVGNLAFRYLLNIIPEQAVAAGEVDLADVIDVYIVKNPTADIERADLATMTKVGTLASLMEDPDGAARGILLPAEGSKNVALAEEDKALAETGAVTMGIALKMQESAGNEYQNLSVGEGFRVELLATQYTWENDSFDNTYDAGLEPVGEDEVLVEEDGIQYVYAPGGEKMLYLVTDKYTSDTVNVPEGVTSLGNYSFYYNSNVKTVNVPASVKDLGRAFDSSKVETVNLSEGLETISNRAFRNTSALKTVTIPSTVTTIQESAFQNSGITEIVVPASVTSIEKAAFGYCPNLKTITIEGNPVIANYAARACASLETVNLLGENVTFSGTSMAFSNAESGKSDNITILVENDTVAAAVQTANGSCTGYKLAVKTGDGLYRDTAGNSYVTTATGLSALNEWINAHSNNAFWGKTYNIIADIDASGTTWTPKFMVPDSTTFDGIVFNGNGHTIKNLTINGQGMFTGSTKGSTSTVPTVFKDITFDNVTVNGGTHHNGVVWGEVYGDLTLENVNVVNSNITGGCNVGGLVGRNSEIPARIEFDSCSVKNTNVTATTVGDYAGASAFLGMALKTSGTSINLIFEGNNVAEGNTLTSADGLSGGGIYTTAEWGTSSWDVPVVVNSFTNFAN